MDASELARMQDDLETLMPDTCTILSVTHTPDGMGGWTDTEGTVSTGTPCRLDTRRGYLAVQGAAPQPYSALVMTLPYDAVVAVTDHILHNGIRYAVTAVTVSSWQACKRVEVAKL